MTEEQDKNKKDELTKMIEEIMQEVFKDFKADDEEEESGEEE